MQIEAAVSKFDIEVDGRLVPAESGQTVAAALIAAGIAVFRYTPNRRAPARDLLRDGCLFRLSGDGGWLGRAAGVHDAGSARHAGADPVCRG